MKPSKSKNLLLGGGFILAAALLYFTMGQRVRLLAEEEIKVTVDPHGEKEVVGVIQAGQEVPVLKCEDLKHYIVPKVKLANGAEGYVLKGKFKINRHASWSSSASPISFTC